MVTLVFLAGLAAWIATSTIVEAEVFRDVREACDKVHEKHNNWWSYKLRYLIHCHMCTGLWVSAIIALFIPPVVPITFFGWGITALAIKGIGHSFLVLQKFFEAKTDEHNTQADLRKLDIERTEHWMSLEKQNASDVDSPSVNSY